MMWEDFVLKKRKTRRTKRTRKKMIWKNQRMTTAATTLIRIKMEKTMEMMMVMERMMTGVYQSHYFQTEKTSLHLVQALLLRTMKSRMVKMTMPAMEVGKTLRRRKMSKCLPDIRNKVKNKKHKKMSFQSKFPAN